ncbi:MAG: desulfoferrodoxin [Candidatus Aureabacteria bacterium]|nr:desulfoferrodoxin [Candidatus Auribacterota bacterium]
MTKNLQIYRCEVCGNIVEILHTGVGVLVCCLKEMKLLVENTVDAAKEKHVPVIEKIAGGVRVQVGSVPHPMEEKHYIEWIEIIADGKAYRQFLKPGEAPQAEFTISDTQLAAREYCNLHGLWKS